jgi:hypothetical protein
MAGEDMGFANYVGLLYFTIALSFLGVVGRMDNFGFYELMRAGGAMVYHPAVLRQIETANSNNPQ